MTIIFGSDEALEILQRDKRIEAKIKNLQDEYDDQKQLLEDAEFNLSEAEADCAYHSMELKKLRDFAKKHNVELADD